jgi:hypothetical protein
MEDDRLDFMQVLRTSFTHENNPDNPANKPDLLRSIKGVRAHKTFVNDESFSITKRFEKYKNVPPEIRITTMCCLIAREIKGTKKSIFVIEMFISEIALVNREIFKKNFSYIGTLFKTYFIEDVIKVIYHSTPSWPTRNGLDNVDLYPDFDLTIDKSELHPSTTFTAIRTETPSNSVRDESIDSLVDFIEPKPKKKKIRRKTSYARSESHTKFVNESTLRVEGYGEAVSIGSQTKTANIFDSESAREFLRKRWIQACEYETTPSVAYGNIAN